MSKAQANDEEAGIAPLIAVTSVSALREGRRMDPRNRQIVHRECTGNAERDDADLAETPTAAEGWPGFWPLVATGAKS